MKLTGKKVAVLISDTYSRPFRRGQVEYTVGIAGISPFKDYRGKKDLFNYDLKVKNTAVADEITSAAELVMGQGNEGIPVAVIKNLKVPSQERASIGDLLISKNEDLFTNAL
jgi:coenzyme F420-0:L-glutamate ligase/coenzyme F420-1:gamma-L-glutamate ligase